jgi:hypothetical protein
LSFSAGKVNIDSIKEAPSEMPNSDLNIVSIPPDSLAQYIGNVYVIKTGEDPRLERPLYAKLKILDFSVRDVENHEIDMVFAYVFNRSGYTDLLSENFDTFTLDYTVDTITGSSVFISGHSRQFFLQSSVLSNGFVTVAVNGVISMPEGIAARGGILRIFDPKGRFLGQVRSEDVPGNGSLRINGGYCGVVVVR